MKKIVIYACIYTLDGVECKSCCEKQHLRLSNLETFFEKFIVKNKCKRKMKKMSKKCWQRKKDL